MHRGRSGQNGRDSRRGFRPPSHRSEFSARRDGDGLAGWPRWLFGSATRKRSESRIGWPATLRSLSDTWRTVDSAVRLLVIRIDSSSSPTTSSPAVVTCRYCRCEVGRPLHRAASRCRRHSAQLGAGGVVAGHAEAARRLVARLGSYTHAPSRAASSSARMAATFPKSSGMFGVGSMKAVKRVTSTKDVLGPSAEVRAGRCGPGKRVLCDSGPAPLLRRRLEDQPVVRRPTRARSCVSLRALSPPTRRYTAGEDATS